MFKKKVKEEPKSDVLAQIRDILFPMTEKRVDRDGTSYQIDCSVDMNLEAALTDLADDINDSTVRNTIHNVTKRLFKVRELLEHQIFVHEGVEYHLLGLSRGIDDE